MSVDGCSPDDVADIDRLMHSLGDGIRRKVICYFENVCPGVTTTLDELTDYVDDRMAHVDRETIRVDLWHNHLPTLDERGWLDVDERTEVIRYYGHDDAEQLMREVMDIFLE